jgi:peptidyl-tRNA hydrolase
MKYVIYKYHEYNFTKGFIIVAVTDTEEDAKKLVKDKNYSYERVKYIKKEGQTLL